MDSGGDKHSRTEKETRFSSKICYRCGKEGHIKCDCWVKVTCSQCGKSGHIKKNCQVNLRGVEANATHEGYDQQGNMEVIDQLENMASLTHPGDSIDYENDWIVYSGCLHHATGDVKLFSNVRPQEGKRVIVIADNSLHPVMKEGKFEGKFNDDDNSKGDEFVSLKDVYHVLGLKKNLASVL